MNNVPQHIGVIMDGNRRWAKAHGLSILAGHRKVVDDVLEPLIEHAAMRGVKYLTFWAWSTENWKRDRREVQGIMRLFKKNLRKRGNRLQEKGIRVRIIGDIATFDPELQKLLCELVEKTKHNTVITVVFALNYGGRDEIIRAMNKAISYQLLASLEHRRSGSAIRQGIREDKDIVAEDWRLTTDDFVNLLDTSGIPDPDLIVRTGGEERLSGFLLWQSEYSEFYFPKWFMPEFTPERLDESMEEYAKRKRRYGG